MKENVKRIYGLPLSFALQAFQGFFFISLQLIQSHQLSKANADDGFR